MGTVARRHFLHTPSPNWTLEAPRQAVDLFLLAALTVKPPLSLGWTRQSVVCVAESTSDEPVTSVQRAAEPELAQNQRRPVID